MRILALASLVLGACSLSADYTGTFYQCAADGSCPDGYVCKQEVCVPTEPPPPACSTTISGGNQHACAIRTDGTVWCWGRNDYGQLGDGTIADSAVPVQVAGITDAHEVRAGELFSCARSGAGAMQCWGRNDFGQLGDGTKADSRTPVQVQNVSGATSIALGDSFACVIAGGGAVSCWGENGDGQLGDGTKTTRSSPAAIGGYTAKAISADRSTTCAVGTDGVVSCWGANDEGQLGSGDNLSQSRPNATELTGMAGVAVGGGFSCAFDAAGRVFCSGSNVYGDLGIGTETSYGNPSQNTTRYVQAQLPAKAVELVAAADHVCARDDQHQLWCWGRAEDGRFGDGNFANRTRPVLTPFVNVAAFGLADQTTCVIDDTGASRCAGDNSRGQLGDGRPTSKGTPQAVLGLTGATAVGVGGDHSCAVIAGGAVSCWGANQRGQLGNGTYERSAKATAVVGGLANVKKVRAGTEHTCALTEAGEVWCWGANYRNQLASGTSDSPAPRPVDLGGTATDLAVGAETTCALVAGTAKCWGQGYTGVADTGQRQVSGVATGNGHTCVIAGANAAVSCIGANGDGQLGNGDTMSQTTYVSTGVTNATDVQARYNMTCARSAAGLQCWGLGADGRLGTGNGTSKSTPQTLALDAVAQVTMGWDQTCARKTDNSVWCWGAGYYGSLGDPSYLGHAMPYQVPNLSATDIASGGTHVCAVKADKTVVCWGQNFDGQLGDGLMRDLDVAGVAMTCPGAE